MYLNAGEVYEDNVPSFTDILGVVEIIESMFIG